MAEMLSAGVYVTEIDASAIVPSVSNSTAVFAGNFHQGRVGKYTLITNTDELVSFYGKPSDVNYNDFYQAYNFLQYGNRLLVSRAANTNGKATPISGVTVKTALSAKTGKTVALNSTSGLTVGDWISFGGSETSGTFYEVVSIVADTSVTLDRNVEDALTVNEVVNSVIVSTNGVFEATTGLTEAVVNNYDYLGKMITIGNEDEFETLETSIAFSNASQSKLKIIAKNPGAWASKLEIAIANPTAFKNAKQAFDGIALDDLFEYAPTGTEIGIIIKFDDEIKEIFTVDFDKTAKDINGKSTYIETVINSQSNYIFIKDNSLVASVKDYLFSNTGTAKTITLVNGKDSAIQADDLIEAYSLFDNKEALDIDIVIANELDSGSSAKELCDTRKDCIGFIGANYGDVVGKKASDAVSNLITWRSTGSLNFNNMFVVACGNYKYIYDRYNDKNRWVNIAGDVAGLRAATSQNRASWWASAGLERGQVKNCLKLAFNPTQGQRDMLYKNGLNPIVSFPGQGIVVWGQKTLLDKASSFDRVNVRGLFNTLERSLSKMAKYQVMEFNDNFTRNRIVAMIKPFLSSVQAGRGIQDYLVICDESNNTADVISRNQLVVDVYIKPTYVAEFIHLKFTNAGTNSFSSVIGGA